MPGPNRGQRAGQPSVIFTALDDGRRQPSPAVQVLGGRPGACPASGLGLLAQEDPRPLIMPYSSSDEGPGQPRALREGGARPTGHTSLPHTYQPSLSPSLCPPNTREAPVVFEHHQGGKLRFAEDQCLTQGPLESEW